MESSAAPLRCIVCCEAIEELASFPVFFTFLKSNNILVADALERFLLRNIEAISDKGHVVCVKCYDVFEELTALELKFRELRVKLWNLYKTASSSNNHEIEDLIRGVEVQTVDEFHEPEDKSESAFSRVEVACNVKIEEELTIDVDPTCEFDDGKEDESTPNRKSKVSPRSCDICGKWFKEKSQLELHLIKHRKKGEDRNSQQVLYDLWKRRCRFCNNEFKAYRDLKQHLNKHKDEELLYKCRLCDKEMSTRAGAFYHCRTHDKSVTGNFDLENAFHLIVQPRRPRAKKLPPKDGTQIVIDGNDNEDMSSEDDELPLSKRRKEFMFEKILQDVVSKKPDSQKTGRNKALEDLGRFGEVDVTKISAAVDQNQRNRPESSDDTQDPFVMDEVVDGIRNSELRDKITELSKSKSVIIRKSSKKSAIKAPRRVRVEEKYEAVKVDDEGDGARTKERREPRCMMTLESKYKCDLCDKLWKTRGELNAHRKTHDDARPYICEICGQSYKHKQALDVHVGMHKGIFQHQCPHCMKAFTQKGALIRHLPIHTGELPYQCELCGKRFVHRTSFSIHTLAHTGVRNIRCQICNLGVLSKSHLRRHMRIHSGEKPYECPSCGKTFAERYNLVAHQRIHDPSQQGMPRTPKKKTHVCRVCSTTFTCRQRLEEHMVQDHCKVEQGDGQHSRPSIFENSDSYVPPQRFLINESENSSKADSEHSEDIKRRRAVPSMLRGMDIIRNALDGPLVRIATGEGPPHGWAYLPNS